MTILRLFFHANDHEVSIISKHHCRTVCDEKISDYLSQENAHCRDGGVGPHEAKCDADGRPDDRQEGKEPHPRAAFSHEALRLFHVLLAHVEVSLHPFHLAHASHAVVEHAPRPVADGAIDEQRQWLKPSRHEAGHHRLAAEGEEASGYKGRYKHACVTIADKKLDEGVHELYAMMARVPSMMR